LLGVLSVIERHASFNELGAYSGMGADAARRHYCKLVEAGIVLESDAGYRVNPHIEPLLDRESQYAAVSRIIRTQGSTAVRQLFDSARECGLHQAMVQLCPNHLVWPNSSLQRILSPERMMERLSEDDFDYYLRASVDLVVVSTTTCLPLIAIELDSARHETECQPQRDERKDRIFAAGGIPFMRLQSVGRPSESVIRGQVAAQLDTLVRTLRTGMPGHEQARTLLEDLAGMKVDSDS
jgi:hypothetical protein